MKKHLIILFLSVLGVSVHAQSVSMYDLINLSTLNNQEAQNFLTYNRPFHQLYMQNIKGLDIVHYHIGASTTNNETIIIGNGVKTQEGAFLHSVSYITNNTKYIQSLILQAKKAGLKMRFKGADPNRNIYLFDSIFYTVNIYINNDNSSGTVEVEQNEYNDYQ